MNNEFHTTPMVVHWRKSRQERCACLALPLMLCGLQTIGYWRMSCLFGGGGVEPAWPHVSMEELQVPALTGPATLFRRPTHALPHPPAPLAMAVTAHCITLSCFAELAFVCTGVLFSHSHHLCLGRHAHSFTAVPLSFARLDAVSHGVLVVGCDEVACSRSFHLKQPSPVFAFPCS
jgi:hypothetical protein